jgi:hypothetical protein
MWFYKKYNRQTDEMSVILYVFSWCRPNTCKAMLKLYVVHFSNMTKNNVCTIEIYVTKENLP